MYLTSAFIFPLNPFKNKNLRVEEIAPQLDHLLLLQRENIGAGPAPTDL